MQKIGKLFLVLFFQILVVSAFAADSLKVEVQPESVGLGDTVQIYLTVQSSDDFEMADPKVPQIDGLKLLQAQNAGQSSSTRMNFVNGKTDFQKTVSQQFVFVYEATKAGIVMIPSFTVEVNGKQMMSAPQKMSVSREGQQQQQQQQRPNVAGRPNFQEDDPFAEEDDMFAQLMKQRQKMLDEVQRQMGGQGFGGGGRGGNPNFNPGFAQPNQIPSRTIEGLNTNEAFFILLDVDKKQVYEGEQITATWHIYTRGNLESLDRAKFPDLKGFWKEIIEEVPSLQFTEEQVNGVMYRKALLAAHALFPIKPGKVTIDEFKIKGKVRLPTQFGWGSAQEYTKSSKRLEVSVLPLPQEGKPLTFSGAVGQFQIQTQVDGTSFPAGQPISLRVRLEGQGNAKVIELPAIQWPENLEVYDTKSESKFFKDGLSYKEFEILVIAKAPGEVKVPQINFSYFDPTLKQYITKSTEEFKITITEPIKGSTLAPLKASDKAATEKAAEEKIFLPITELSSSWVPWGDVKLPVLLIVTLGAVFTVLGQFLLALKNLRLAPQLSFKVETKMKVLEGAVKNKDYKLFGAEAINLLYLVTAHLAQEESATQDWAALFYKMPENYRQSYEKKLNELFDYFQMVGFAPESVREQALSRNSAEEMFKELKLTSNKIVSELP
ncbi:BatD family protein [Pseudobdellovibrio sp. HCB154]|uniref:BatD family protein n=1 Tax=Pseudobdellovibrio sp. HCB154 TaxID=3386277 RepID=UPI0039174551